jgi:hypothetical protein
MFGCKRLIGGCASPEVSQTRHSACFSSSSGEPHVPTREIPIW